jgi:hypothetical protein
MEGTKPVRGCIRSGVDHDAMRVKGVSHCVKVCGIN